MLLTMPLLLLFIIQLCSLASSTVHYVSTSTSDPQNLDGTSWSKAYPELSMALQGASAGDEIWIAAGHYYPTADPGDRDACFSVENTLTIYGGFAGTESSVNERPFPLGETIIDGNSSVSCYHIIGILDTADNTTFNGLIFENGNANDIGDGEDTNQYGGVLYSYDIENFHLRFENCTFRNNNAREGGALWFDDTINVTITDCIFENNTAINGSYLGGYGGAIFCQYYCKLEIYNTKFISNEAYFKGGAIYGDYGAHIHCYNCDFMDNSIMFAGHGGAIFMEDRNSQSSGTYVYLENNHFVRNTATMYGGAVCWFNGVTPSIIDTTFEYNIGGIGGAIVNFDDIFYDEYKDVTFTNNIATLNASYKNIYNDSLPVDYLSDLLKLVRNAVNISDYLDELWELRSLTLDYNYRVPESDYICLVNAATPACAGGMLLT